MTSGGLKEAVLHLSRRDVTILKGVGILLIFLHNFFHWQPGMGIENEFVFAAANASKYLARAFDGVLNFLRYSLAFFGHFGVQLFVLTSGYGLYLSSQRKSVPEPYFKFLIPKVIKIFSLLLLGALVISSIQYLHHGTPFNIRVIFSIIFFRITSFWNFSHDTIFNSSGPFWFFGLIVQLYVLFPFLVRLVGKWSLRQDLLLLLAISLINVFLYPMLQRHNVPLMGLFIGQLPVFLLGIIWAKHGYRFHWAALVVSVACFALGQRYELFFTTTFIAITYLMMAAFFGLKRLGGLSVTRLPWVFEALGGISMAVFILNGPLRTLPLFRDGTGNLLTGRIFLFTAILIVASIPLAYLFKKLNAVLFGLYALVQAQWVKRLRPAR